MYIDLRPLASQIENSIEVGQTPTLAILKYGDKADSKAYISSIEKKALQLGVKVMVEDSKEVGNPDLRILDLVYTTNAILPVNPISKNMKEIIKNRLYGFMDVDNFTGTSKFPNCTGQAVLEILKYFEIGLEKKICILGRGIGAEIHKVLEKADYSPTTIHSKTPGILAEERIKEADVVVSATGVKGLIKKDMVKAGAIVIDVGLGDIAKGVEEIADVTTVKDGVGAVTTAVLFKHIFQTVK